MKIFFCTTGLVSLSLLAIALVTPMVPASAEPIKVGAIYNLTGGMAPLDAPSARGASLAVKEINTAGGVLGRDLELVMHDGKSDAATISNTAQRLIDVDKAVIVIGFSDTDMTLAAAPIAARAGIVFLTSGATSPRLPEQVPGYLFLACFGDNVQAAAGAEYAYGNLSARTAYLLVDTEMEYTVGLGRYFKERFSELGGKIVLEDTYQSGDAAFSSQVTRVSRLSPLPDILYIAAGPDEAGIIARQFREAGIGKPIIGGDGYDTPLLVKAAGKGADNIYFSTHALIDAQRGTDSVKKFIASYQSEYKTPPENAFAGLGYDTVRLLADALKRAGSDNPEAIREALQKTKNLAGVTGTITYLQGSRIPQKGVTMILVKDGNFTLAAEVVPQKAPAP